MIQTLIPGAPILAPAVDHLHMAACFKITGKMVNLVSTTAIAQSTPAANYHPVAEQIANYARLIPAIGTFPANDIAQKHRQTSDSKNPVTQSNQKITIQKT